jgi:glycosyltransferase involved in cell wall biosynthesis
MRITVVCSVYPPAAAPEAAHASHLCRNLAARGQTVTLVTSKVDGPAPTDPAFAIQATMPGWRWRDMGQLKRELAASRPDAVILIYLGAIYAKHPMITYLPTICQGLKPRPVVVTQFENIQGSEVKSFGVRVGRKLWEWRAGRQDIEYRYGTLLRDSDAVIALCEPHLDAVAKTYPAVRAKSRVIPAPPLLTIVDDADGSARRDTRAKLGFAEGDFVVSYFGYIYPEKGVETVLEAAAAAAKRVPNLKLMMIGGSPKAANPRDPNYAERMRKLADDLGLGGRTTWTGHLDPEGDGASKHLHAADLSLMPFVQGIRLNNSSYSVVSSHGLPVVTTRGEPLEADFKDRDNVLLFPPGDATAAAEAVVEVATVPTLRQGLRDGALAFSRGRASWDAVVRQTLELCERSRAV